MDTPSGALIEEHVFAMQRHAGVTSLHAPVRDGRATPTSSTLGAPVEVAS